MPRTFAHKFDCPAQKVAWDKYTKDNLIIDKDMFCVAGKGAVDTNKAGTVWKSQLKFRTKDESICGDRYVALGNLSAAHFNQQYIMQWEGSYDYCCQEEFCTLLGVPILPVNRGKWGDINMSRAMKSIKRHKDEHKIQVAKQKKKKRQEKQDDAKDASGRAQSYKSQGRWGKANGLSSGKGSAGSSGGNRIRMCSKCGEEKEHEPSKRSCVGCRGKQNNKQPKAKAKKRKRTKATADSDEEEEEEEEEEEYDEATDPVLMRDLSDRIKEVKAGSRLEYKAECWSEDDPGDVWHSWEAGKVLGIVSERRRGEVPRGQNESAH